MIELQSVRFFRMHQVCGSGRDLVKAEDGYQIMLRPDLLSVVITQIPRTDPRQGVVNGDHPILQSIIPYFDVSDSVPKKAILRTEDPYRLDPRAEPEPLAEAVADQAEAKQEADNQDAEEKKEKRREVLEQNRKNRWKKKKGKR